MKRYSFILIVSAMSMVASADTWTDPETGITWTYTVSNGEASLGSGRYGGPAAVSTDTTGNLSIPSMLGVYPVTGIGDFAFAGCSGLTGVTIPGSVKNIEWRAFADCTGLACVTIPDGVTKIRGQAFYGCSGLKRVMIPDSVTYIERWAFANCCNLKKLTIPTNVKNIERWTFEGCNCCLFFVGEPPLNLECGSYSQTDFLDRNTITYSSVYETEWLNYLLQKGVYDNNGRIVAEILSSSIRENDSTIMDIRYIVYKGGVARTPKPIKVRTLAFEDGVRSFAKVVRPETFIDGTATNIGDNVAANGEHKLSWKVSEDWATRLAKVKFEVLANDGNLLPLKLRTIPASEQYGKMKVSWNAITDSQAFDALMWLYADKDAGLTLVNGVLRNGSTQLANGTGTSNLNAISYIYSKMGYDRLSGAVLNYVNEETRLGLAPDGVRQYAYKLEE